MIRSARHQVSAPSGWDHERLWVSMDDHRDRNRHSLRPEYVGKRACVVWGMGNADGVFRCDSTEVTAKRKAKFARSAIVHTVERFEP